ncbi:MAG: D-alanine--D-alanine ligase family protein [Bacteroidota bacterium]
MKNIAIIFGGKSPEHQISVRSARNINAAIDRTQFEVIHIGIDRKGKWWLTDIAETEKYVSEAGIPLGFVIGDEQPIIRLDNQQPLSIDLLYLVLHGPNGEDGTIQGLARLLNLPFIGPDVLGSAAVMDKDLTKRLLRQADIKVAPDYVVYKYEKTKLDYAAITTELGAPIFIKPANAGSSIGVHKVSEAETFQAAIDDAFQYDDKVIIEAAIIGRELEAAVMGNQQPVAASSVAEIVTAEEYSFEEKYSDASQTKVLVPAPVEQSVLAQLRSTALKAYRVTGCAGLTRVDMFLTEAGEIFVNELNTLPGFTNISVYPKLWAHDGMSQTALITRLIEYAFERYESQKALAMDFD